MLGPILKTPPQIRVLESPNWHRDWETSTKRKYGKSYTKKKVSNQKRQKFLQMLDGNLGPQTFFKTIEI